jgi:hypothetical protein
MLHIHDAKLTWEKIKADRAKEERAQQQREFEARKSKMFNRLLALNKAGIISIEELKTQMHASTIEEIEESEVFINTLLALHSGKTSSGGDRPLSSSSGSS